MINAIYGKKIGMTQLFNDKDEVVAVTVIQAEPNTICHVKTTDTDGYEAVQLGFGAIKDKNVTNPMRGHFDKLGVAPCRHLREVRVENASEYVSVAGIPGSYFNSFGDCTSEASGGAGMLCKDLLAYFGGLGR